MSFVGLGGSGGGGKGKARGEGHRSVTRTSGGMEGTADSYRRVQQAALANDINYPKKSAETLSVIAEQQREQNAALRRLIPGGVIS